MNNIFQSFGGFVYKIIKCIFVCIFVVIVILIGSCIYMNIQSNNKDKTILKLQYDIKLLQETPKADTKITQFLQDELKKLKSELKEVRAECERTKTDKFTIETKLHNTEQTFNSCKNELDITKMQLNIIKEKLHNESNKRTLTSREHTSIVSIENKNNKTRTIAFVKPHFDDLSKYVQAKY